MGPGFESLKVHQKFVLFTQRVHLFPFRTQKLSSAVPTILAWRRAGKIGRCEHKEQRVVGVNSAQGPPVPIPNTEVKLCWAENTCLATSREDRSMPTHLLIFLSLRRGKKDSSRKRVYNTSVAREGLHEPYSSIAQSVEHLTVNQGVTGSSPVGGAKKFRTRKCAEFLLITSSLFTFH